MVEPDPPPVVVDPVVVDPVVVDPVVVDPVVVDAGPVVETVLPVVEDATLRGSGSIRFFSGGSVDDLSPRQPRRLAPAARSSGSRRTMARGLLFLSTTAPAFANAPFTAAFPDGFPDGPTGVWVSSCDAGSMPSEGSLGEEG